MNIKYVEGDIFAPIHADQEPGAIILPHVCNDRGAWGAGFVIPLAKNFSAARHAYLHWHDNRNGIHGESKYPPFVMGNTQIVNIDDKVFVANMLAQTLGGVRPLYYNHLSRCLDDVAKFVLERDEAREHKSRIMAPMFGSALAGGDWNIIENLICDSWLRRQIPVTIYYLPGTLPDNWELPKV